MLRPCVVSEDHLKSISHHTGLQDKILSLEEKSRVSLSRMYVVDASKTHSGLRRWLQPKAETASCQRASDAGFEVLSQPALLPWVRQAACAKAKAYTLHKKCSFFLSAADLARCALGYIISRPIGAALMWAKVFVTHDDNSCGRLATLVQASV